MRGRGIIINVVACALFVFAFIDRRFGKPINADVEMVGGTIALFLGWVLEAVVERR